MKKLILLELCLLFLATTFRGDSPPSGWYIQQIPVNKNITDIYFTDTLNGWAVASNTGQLDSGYILKTTNGGANWLLNYSTDRNFFAIQFTDVNTGYASGGWGPGLFYKTINGGNNWNILATGGIRFTDLYFLNKDTGWICDNGISPFGAGLQKTTNGGLNWFQQMSNSYQPKKIFFLNKDTGWVMTADRKLYRTMNSGGNWAFLHSFSDEAYSLSFVSNDTGWVIHYGSIQKTVDGGTNWIAQIDPNPGGSFPYDIKMINSHYGYISTAYTKILKTIDGNNWRKQNAPNGGYTALYFTDSLHGWSSQTSGGNNIAATVDGGGPVLGVRQISGEAPDGYKLEQNYPNPFNSITNFKFQILNSGNIKIIIYDLSGKEITTLVNERLQAGTYQQRFDAGSLSSGVYFYALLADGKRVDTKKMVLVK